MLLLKSYRYNNPLVVASSISMFLIFTKMRIGSIRWINRLSATVVAAYLIHEHPAVRPLLAAEIRMIHEAFPIYCQMGIYFMVALSFILLGFAVENIRGLIMTPIIRYIEKRKNKIEKQKLSQNG